MLIIRTPALPPLFFMAIAHMLGIVCQASFSYWHPLYYTPICILIIIYFLIKKYYYVYNLLPLIFLWGSYSYYRQEKNYLDFLETVHNQKVCIEGYIEDIITNTHSHTPLCLTVTTTTITAPQLTCVEQKRLLIYTHLPALPRIGDRILLKNCSIKKTGNPHYVRYLIKEKIDGSLFVSSHHIEIVPSGPTIKRYIFEQRQRIFTGLKNTLSSSTFNLFSPIFLGNKQSVKHENDALNEHFKEWGISHYLARSGLHLIVFIWIWQALLQYLPLSFALKQSILMLLSLIYLLMSWSSVSFWRAVCTFGVCKIYNIMKKPFNFINVLALISLIFLSANPYQLFFLDFQLSFLLTFALAWHNNFMRTIKNH